MNIDISNCANLILKIFVIGYSECGESILVLIMDKSQGDILYSFVVDCYEKGQMNKTIEILNQYSITNINLLCWSHPDADHTRGIDKIIEGFCSEKTKIIIPYALNGKDHDVINYNKDDKYIVELIAKINSRSLETQITACVTPNLSQEMERFAVVDYTDKISISIKALSPHSSYVNNKIFQEKNLLKNDLSVVLLMEVGSYKFLFCSDVENLTISRLDETANDNPILVKIPHHTSPSSADLLDWLNLSLNNTFACTTTYERHSLPHSYLLQGYTYKCKKVHTTGLKKDKGHEYGIIEYTFDLYDEQTIDIKTHGNASVVNKM